MNIDSTSSSNNLLQLLEAAQASQTSSSNSISSLLGNASSTGVTGTTASDSSSLSAQAKLFHELQKLSKNDPAEFKKITAEIGQQLSSEAGSSTNPGQASFLSAMASNFDKASQSGNFSDLFPGQSSSTGSTSSASGIAHYGQQASSSSSTSASADPLQTIFAKALQQIQTDLSSTSST